MILSMSGQAAIFLMTVAVGFFIGLVYDIFRVFRSAVPHSWPFVALEDLLFWVMVTVAMFYVMLNYNSGEVRPFAVVGAFLGMILYFATLSRLVVKLGGLIANIIKRVLFFVFKAVTTPFALLFRLLSVPVKFCAKILKKLLTNLKNILIKSFGYATIQFKKLKFRRAAAAVEDPPVSPIKRVTVTSSDSWRM